MVYQQFGFGRMMLPGVKNLIIINVAVFVAFYLFGLNRAFSPILGLVPQFVIGKGFIWQLVTYMFLHNGFGHIMINMFMLWMFGTELEVNWGTREFIKYYFITGIGAGIISMLWYLRTLTIIVGASGAIFGLLLAFGMLFPRRIIYVMGIFPMEARYMVIIFGGIEFLAGLGGPSGIAHFAHVGGIVVGYVYLKWGWKADIYWENFKKNRQKRKYRVVRPDTFVDRDLKEEVDRILDKVSEQGLDSLTTREKKILQKASKHLKKKD